MDGCMRIDENMLCYGVPKDRRRLGIANLIECMLERHGSGSGSILDVKQIHTRKHAELR